jgi:hypothetical protein
LSHGIGGGGWLESSSELGCLQRFGQDQSVQDDDGAVGEQFNQDEFAPENVIGLEWSEKECLLLDVPLFVIPCQSAKVLAFIVFQL